MDPFRTHDERGVNNLMWGTAPPSSSNTGAEGGPFMIGDYVRNTNYVEGESPRGWICTVAGTPGTWRPEWGGPSAVRTVAAAATFDAEDDCHIVLNTAAATRACTIPAPSTCKGTLAIVTRDGGNAATVTAGASLIAGLTTVTLGSDEASVMLKSDGSMWRVIGTYGTVSIA